MQRLILFMLFLPGMFSAQYTWIQRDSVPSTARQWPAVFTIGNHAYVVGGCVHANCSREVWRYDGVGHKWHRMSDFPATGRALAATFVVAGKGCVVGATDPPVSVHQGKR